MADPVTITGGTTVYDKGSGFSQVSANANLTGTDGFSFVGNLFNTSRFPIQCFPCLPGEVVSLAAVAGEGDIGGTATFNGLSFQLGSLDNPARGSFFMEFMGSFVAPPAGSPTTTVSAPFTFSGLLFLPRNVSGAIVPVTGSGFATAFLISPPPGLPGSQAWAVTDVEYTFEPTPEPATLAFVGSALAGLAAKGWRRAKRR